MRKAIFTVLLAVLFSAGLVASVCAQMPAEDYADIQKKLNQGKSGEFTGTVKFVDPKAKTLVVDVTSPPGAGERAARLDFAKSGRSAASDLKPGDKVAGQYQELNGIIFVTGIKKTG